MGLLAAHLNDAGISVQDRTRILYREPGFALLDDERLVTGNEAFAAARIKPRLVQHTFWSELSTDPIADQRFRHLCAADLASRQLEQVWRSVAKPDDRLIVAVPAFMNTDHLGLLLGVAAELEIPVVAMADAAVAATRRHYENAVPVHVDLGLHSALLTRIAQAGEAQLDRAAVVESSGVLALYDAWIRVIAAAFVKQSRFDPLHTAETEQSLQDSLPAWLGAASGQDTVRLEVEYRDISHEAEIESLELIAVAAPVYQRIVTQLRALYRADEMPALQLSDRAARMPGLADMLRARVGGEVYLLEPGATARGLLARCRDVEPGAGAISLIRSLPWDQSSVTLEARAAVAGGGHPTHVLFGDTAFAVDERPLSFGTQPLAGERWIDLERDMPGISRRHCSLTRENGQCVVHDHSRYGTFLNGHRIDGSAVLQVGDRLRLGTPGFELRLIRAEAAGGA